jgi:hypothetical protein
MKKKSLQKAGAPDRQYDQLRQRLSQIGYLSQGSVQDRTARQGGGAGYQWTRKVAGKTVSVSLTQEQFGHMRQAIDNYREVRRFLGRMEKLSRKIIFGRLPHPDRRKRLSAKVLGTK